MTVSDRSDSGGNPPAENEFNYVQSQAYRNQQVSAEANAGSRNQARPSAGSAERKPKRKPNEYERADLNQIKKEIRLVDLAREYNFTPEPVGNKRSLYRLKEHDSLIIFDDTNTFYQYSVGRGGTNIDFLMQMENMTLPAAIKTLSDKHYSEHEPVYTHKKDDPAPEPERVRDPAPVNQPGQDKETVQEQSPKRAPLELPPAFEGRYSRVTAYLIYKRCINPQVVRFCMQNKAKGSYLYQDNRNNVVFVGVDEDGKPAYAMKRATLSYSNYKGECKGSNGDVGWFLNNHADKLYVCESAIDALSVMTMRLEMPTAHPIESASYLSLGGAGKIKSLEYHLRAHPEIKHVVACCDNDPAGKHGNFNIQKLIKEKFPDVSVSIASRFSGKDVNATLVAQKKQEASAQSKSRSPTKATQVEVKPDDSKPENGQGTMQVHSIRSGPGL